MWNREPSGCHRSAPDRDSRERSNGGGREAHGMENPRRTYAAGLRARPALLVRGSSRRITIMRFRPANIRVINRRDSRLGHLRCCVFSNIDVKRRKNALRKTWPGITNELI